MTTQEDLLEWSKTTPAQKLRDQRDLAMKRVEMKNENGPNEAALDHLAETLQRLPRMAEVTSDSLFPDVKRFGFSDNRAIGPIMRRAAAAGWIAPTDRHRNSSRPGNHCVPRRVYLNTYTGRGEG